MRHININLWILILLSYSLLLCACEGPDQLFREPQPAGEKEVREIPIDFQGVWGDAHTGERKLWISKGKVMGFDSEMKRILRSELYEKGYLLRQDSLFKTKELAVDSLPRVPDDFIGIVGDTVVQERNYKFPVFDGITQQVLSVSGDSTSICWVGDTLQIQYWGWELYFQQYQYGLIRSKKGYVFLNLTLEQDQWLVFVLKLERPDQLMFTYINNFKEMEKDYFAVEEKQLLTKSGDTITQYYAAPKPRQLFQFLKSDSLEWESAVRLNP
ncbi:MAG: hypothetical protein AAFP89_09970 [Bacteroidota bacterium]